MEKIIKIRQFIRVLKNDIIQNYHQFRINTPQDPYAIVGRSKPYRILFILSHMRSGSSLLTHILNSNPDIIGYGETHIQYTSEADFKRLMLKVYWQAQEFRKIQDIKSLSMYQTYILDKVLHNNKFLDDNFLVSENVYSLFLLREPKRSLASIAELKPHLNQEQVLDYYVQRLSRLEDYAKLINSKKRSLFITHAQLLKHTDLVFEALKIFLDTKQGFSEDYQILKTTGMRDVGDYKGNIKIGRIVRTQRKLETQVAPDLEEKGMRSFEECCATLSNYCRTIES
ncbi:MAG: sulfotransferase family protein [Coleofasciculus sp. G1-WW12-02]|uniref:sulfotransferase family protein n=1 Tax=Coleofasciculus sp. G1-WW12-02 TaxID=3068483 RepID=UPI0032F18855